MDRGFFLCKKYYTISGVIQLNKIIMKKLLIICSLSLVLLSSCSNKWDQRDPDMPKEIVARNEEMLEKAMNLLDENPKDVDGLFGAGFCYQQLGDWKEAVKYYEKVLVIEPTNWATLNNLAYMYETMGDYSKSAEYIKLLYQSDPTGIETIKDTVRILIKAGDSENALKALENFSTVTIDPKSPDEDLQNLISSLYEDILASEQK